MNLAMTNLSHHCVCIHNTGLLQQKNKRQCGRHTKRRQKDNNDISSEPLDNSLQTLY